MTENEAKTKLTPEQQSTVLYWPTKAKIPIITCYSRTKSVDIKNWPNIDFSQVDFDANLAAGEYDNGIALVLGKTLCGSYYSFALDFDGLDAVLEWFGNWEQVLSASQKTRIEWHQDKSRIHYIFLAKRPIANRKINIKDSKLEVRCEKLLLFASPSIHEGGNPYTPMGTTEIAILDEKQLLSLEAKIDSLSQGYMSDENKQQYITWLEDPSTIIEEGGRHDVNKTLGCSFFYRYNNGWKDLTDDQRHDRLQKWNLKHCVPPLPQKELNDIWKWIVDCHRKNRDEQHEQLDDKRRKSVEEVKLDDNIRQELEGNVFYITTNKPLKLTIAYNSTKMLIEASVKTYENELFGKDGNKLTQKINVLNQNKLYLTCIPVSIIKHRNPLSFLETATKYTITFVDSVGNRFTFRHKTLSEIVAALKDDGYAQSDGLEGALGRMILAFAKNGKLVENYDMEYTGFFFDEAAKKIIASNLEIKDKIQIDDLKEALKVVEEAAAKYFTNPDRLDLLATSIAWGMIAPISFVFKSNSVYYLVWLHFWGSPNATKSKTGMIVLAIDGHHKDERFIRNISNIDTIARLGEEIGKTTFPKLVDEVDLNDEKYRTLINQMKSAISSKILRSKFRPNGISATDIPALSPLILTSNAPPPLEDSAYMKRINDRYFDKSESKKENDPEAISFRQFLATELDKLHLLGDFRNWYVMNNQHEVLSSVQQEKMTLLDLGTKILAAAYEYAGIQMPDWLKTRRLPQNQMESSFVDNKVAIKNAFETLININLKNFNKHDIFEESHIKETVSNRVANLLDGRKLPYMKRSRSDGNQVIINTGILAELYKYGITRDQLPNLKALADVMNAVYSRDENGMIIKITMDQISNYFDEVAGDDK